MWEKSGLVWSHFFNSVVSYKKLQRTKLDLIFVHIVYSVVTQNARIATVYFYTFIYSALSLSLPYSIYLVCDCMRTKSMPFNGSFRKRFEGAQIMTYYVQWWCCAQQTQASKNENDGARLCHPFCVHRLLWLEILCSRWFFFSLFGKTVIFRVYSMHPYQIASLCYM